jgi:pilus assembly protein Flp/PilA
MLIDFLNDERGATALEYGLIAAMMSFGVAGGVSAYGEDIEKLFDDIYAAFLTTL